MGEAIAVARAANAAENAKEPEEKHLECAGHAWHWSEFVFILGAGAAIGLTFASGSLSKGSDWIWGIFALAFSLLGTALVWNFITQKRLAKSTRELAQTIKLMVTNNLQMAEEVDRLGNSNNELRNRNSQFKENVKLLGDNVKNFQDLEEQLSGLMNQQEEIVRTRQKHSAELERLMEIQDKNSMKEAQNLLMERVMDQFKNADADGDWKISKGPEWDHMQELLASNGIIITEELDTDGDGDLDDRELEDGLGRMLGEHFNALFVTLRNNREMEEQIEDLNRQLARKKAKF